MPCFSGIILKEIILIVIDIISIIIQGKPLKAFNIDYVRARLKKA